MANVVRQSPMEAAREVWRERFAGSEVIFVAGSVMRGEGTQYSDLDLVVIYAKLPKASRQSFIHKGWPVEAFVHDPETLNYFFWEKDRVSGLPSLPTMVIEGTAIPHESELSKQLKALAQRVIDAGPPEWTAVEMERARYFINDLCDDIRAPRNRAEFIASAARLYDTLADFYFRSANRWSAKGKSVPRKLGEVDPELAERFIKAFDAAFSVQDPSGVLELAELILRPYGGFLFDNYTSDAPPGWRKASPPA